MYVPNGGPGAYASAQVATVAVAVTAAQVLLVALVLVAAHVLVGRS